MPTTTEHTDQAHERVSANGALVGAQAGLDVLLTDAAVGLGTRRFIQPRAVASVGAGVARHPRSVARRAAGLGTALARVAAGRSEQEPPKGDPRSAANVFGQRPKTVVADVPASGSGLAGGPSCADAFARCNVSGASAANRAAIPRIPAVVPNAAE